MCLGSDGSTSFVCSTSELLKRSLLQPATTRLRWVRKDIYHIYCEIDILHERYCFQLLSAVQRRLVL